MKNQLEILDDVKVNDESKNFAFTTFIKKKMYYYMKMLSYKLNYLMIKKILKLALKFKMCIIQKQIDKITKYQTKIKCILQDIDSYTMEDFSDQDISKK